MARPSKLTADLRQRICADIRAGSQVEEAAEAAGISRRTLHRWMTRGEKARFGEHRDLYLAVRAALIDARSALLQTVRRASRYDARAATYLLARSYDRVRPTRPRRKTTPIEEAIARIMVETANSSQTADQETDEPAARGGARRGG